MVFYTSSLLYWYCKEQAIVKTLNQRQKNENLEKVIEKKWFNSRWLHMTILELLGAITLLIIQGFIVSGKCPDDKIASSHFVCFAKYMVSSIRFAFAIARIVSAAVLFFYCKYND